jgi:hypothetical protein
MLRRFVKSWHSLLGMPLDLTQNVHFGGFLNEQIHGR